jgi:hypothetical protein
VLTTINPIFKLLLKLFAKEILNFFKKFSISFGVKFSIFPKKRAYFPALFFINSSMIIPFFQEFNKKSLKVS